MTDNPIPSSLDFADHLAWWNRLTEEQRDAWRDNYGKPVVARQWTKAPTDDDGLPMHPPAPWAGDLDMAFSPTELDFGVPDDQQPPFVPVPEAEQDQHPYRVI